MTPIILPGLLGLLESRARSDFSDVHWVAHLHKSSNEEALPQICRRTMSILP